MSEYDWRDDMHKSWLFALQCARERIVAGGPWPACFGGSQMGYSPGEFTSVDNKKDYHWEGKSKSIALWNHDESQLLLLLDKDNARKAMEQLFMLVHMLEEKRL